MLRRVALVRTGVSEELSASIISVRRLLVRANVVPSSTILFTLMREAQSSTETSVLTRVTRRNIPEDGILHIHYRGYLKSYTVLLFSERMDYLSHYANVLTSVTDPTHSLPLNDCGENCYDSRPYT
jgi:hypothetical protein